MEQNTNGNTNWGELFSLYGSLVSPFREFEERSSDKRAIEQETSNAKGTISYGYKEVIRQAFRRTIIWAIPFLIAFYVIMNVVRVNGEKALQMLDELSEPVDHAMYELLGSMGFMGMLVTAFVICVLPPCLLILFPLMIAGGMISRTCKISKAKRTLDTCNVLLPQAKTAVQEAWKKIAPYVKSIPPDYRNSNALAFFSDSFFNYKVRNLREAVNLYDQYLHQKKMEQSQRESMEAINSLSNQIDDLQDQINSMETVNNYYYYY